MAEAKISHHIKAINLLRVPSEKYRASGASTLLNGTNGTREPSDGQWLGFQGEDFEAIVELRETQSLSEIGIRYLKHTGAWIFPPTQVEVSFSVDGKHFGNAVEYSTQPARKGEHPEVVSWKKEVSGQQARFVRFKAQNIGLCPQWHKGKGERAWLFIDELFIF